ncbi:MAG: PqqD family peptide modification chaperone [Actinomycetota bacterium]
MRAAPEMQVEWVEDEAVVLDPNSRQLHYLNSAAALVYALIQEFGFEEAMHQLEHRYEPDSELREGLPQLLDDMAERGLLIDD